MGKLCKMADGSRQMSDEWLLRNLDKFDLPPSERSAIETAIKNGQAKKVYAETNPSGTRFFEITDIGPRDVAVGKEIFL